MNAEQAVLGSMLVDPDAATEGLDALTPEVFSGAAEAEVFRAMLRCRDQHLAIDIVTVQGAMGELGTRDQVGGMAYLVQLAQSVPTSANIGSYIRQVKDDHKRRRVVQGLQEVLTRAASRPTGELISEAMLMLQRVEDGEAEQDDSMRALAIEEFEAIQRRADGKDAPTDTGLIRLDNIIGGMTNGELWVIGARPSVGKSALAYQIAENVVLGGKSALFISAEMSRPMIAQRMFAGAGVPISVMRRPKEMTEEQGAALAVGLAMAQKLDRLHVDTRSTTIQDIRARCRHMQAHGGLDLLVCDYLQILQTTDHRESRNLEVSAISADLKRMAKEFNVPVIVLSQLSRAGTYGERPSLTHLRDSGAIEQDADVAILMYRLEGEEFKELYGATEDWLRQEGNTIVRMDIAKNRNGPLGHADYMLDGKHVRFAPPVVTLEKEA